MNRFRLYIKNQKNEIFRDTVFHKLEKIKENMPLKESNLLQIKGNDLYDHAFNQKKIKQYSQNHQNLKINIDSTNNEIAKIKEKSIQSHNLLTNINKQEFDKKVIDKQNIIELERKLNKKVFLGEMTYIRFHENDLDISAQRNNNKIFEYLKKSKNFSEIKQYDLKKIKCLNNTKVNNENLYTASDFNLNSEEKNKYRNLSNYNSNENNNLGLRKNSYFKSNTVCDKELFNKKLVRKMNKNTFIPHSKNKTVCNMISSQKPSICNNITSVNEEKTKEEIPLNLSNIQKTNNTRDNDRKITESLLFLTDDIMSVPNNTTNSIKPIYLKTEAYSNKIPQYKLNSIRLTKKHNLNIDLDQIDLKNKNNSDIKSLYHNYKKTNNLINRSNQTSYANSHSKIICCTVNNFLKSRIKELDKSSSNMENKLLNLVEKNIKYPCNGTSSKNNNLLTKKEDEINNFRQQIKDIADKMTNRNFDVKSINNAIILSKTKNMNKKELDNFYDNILMYESLVDDEFDDDRKFKNKKIKYQKEIEARDKQINRNNYQLEQAIKIFNTLEQKNLKLGKKLDIYNNKNENGKLNIS